MYLRKSLSNPTGKGYAVWQHWRQFCVYTNKTEIGDMVKYSYSKVYMHSDQEKRIYFFEAF